MLVGAMRDAATRTLGVPETARVALTLRDRMDAALKVPDTFQGSSHSDVPRPVRGTERGWDGMRVHNDSNPGMAHSCICTCQRSCNWHVCTQVTPTPVPCGTTPTVTVNGGGGDGELRSHA